MKEITQIRSLSLWIFLVPLFAVNICLLISVNFELFEDTLFTVDQIGRSGFTIPYLDGSLSISRASRTFPQYLVFKPGMVITAILLCFYWYKNNLLINHFKDTRFKKNAFMIYGVLSAFFLLIHSILLGLETDIKIFKLLRRVVLLGFIIFEIVAQSLLVLNFYSIKIKFKDYFNLNILKLKILLVSLLIFVAIISVPLLIVNGNVHFKHGLEWNYFIGVILFYLLTNFFWRKKK
ncbi:hypothetical protein OAM15_03865 [Pelagibacteraceae bacterium]|jgi:hypothetical protein|nr:hypothetical protein [Pelagibacteraceae bacterium]